MEADQGGEQEAKVPEMEHFTTRDVTRILDLPADKVRRYARADFMAPERGPHNEYRFTFHDLGPISWPPSVARTTSTASHSTIWF